MTFFWMHKQLNDSVIVVLKTTTKNMIIQIYIQKQLFRNAQTI